MGKLLWSINVTLDGCCDHTQVIADAEFHRYTAAVLDRADGLLLGRVSYELLKSYWPLVARRETPKTDQALLDFADKLDAKRKYVASRTLGEVRWNAALVTGELAPAIEKLKEQVGHVLIFGSPGLGTDLTSAGLIDEYHFLIQPIAAGQGPRLFDGVSRRPFRLLEVRHFVSGVLLTRYERS